MRLGIQPRVKSPRSSYTGLHPRMQLPSGGQKGGGVGEEEEEEAEQELIARPVPGLR